MMLYINLEMSFKLSNLKYISKLHKLYLEINFELCNLYLKIYYELYNLKYVFEFHNPT